MSNVNTTNTNQHLVQSGRVTTEGDDLYYEVRGQGQPFLMISAGGGDGDYYAAVADRLCDEYKVITYDRRANARSTMNNPQNFEISQQSRDAVAVLRAAGETSAFVFGNSSGREQSGEHRISNKVGAGVLMKLELLPVTNYLPDVELIKKNGVGVFMAVGTWALEKKTWYAQAARMLAEQLGCELVTFPAIMVLIWICRRNGLPRCAVSYTKRKQ